MKSVLVIDNYDSFTYNLVQYLRESDMASIKVVLNDHVTPSMVLTYDALVISPGPGLPEESGNLMSILELKEKLPPTLGVCLGLQAIAESFGASLLNLDQVYHGENSMARIVKDDPMFTGLDIDIQVGRYHSWVVDPGSIKGSGLNVTCEIPGGEIMAMAHQDYNIRGVQFHPESVLTPDGRTIIENFLKHCI